MEVKKSVAFSLYMKDLGGETLAEYETWLQFQSKSRATLRQKSRGKSIRLSFESRAFLTTSLYFAEVNEADAVKAEARKFARKAEKITWTKLGAALDRAISKTTHPSYWPSELAKQGVLDT